MSGTYLSENKILDQLFGATSIIASIPATWFIGLSTTTPNEGGTGYTEPTGGAYARVQVTNNKSSFAVAANGVLTNLVAISFPESTLSWGTITHILFFGSSGTDLWYFEQLPTSRTVATATTVYFSVGALTISNNNA